MILDTAQTLASGLVSQEPFRIYTGILGQIGDIIMFTATARRLKELFPRSEITFAVSAKYREAGELVVGLPYINRLFVAELYFERQTDSLSLPWQLGWPVDLRGEDEVEEQRRHDIVLETRPRHRRMPWWAYGHQVAECAYLVGVPGPMDLRTDICIPDGTAIPPDARRKIVLHNDPAISLAKQWPWEYVAHFLRYVGAQDVVLLGGPGPHLPGVLDLRGRTTLAQAAAIITAAKCYVGIDSGLMWIAGSLQAPTVGLYGTSYIPAYAAIRPVNPRALYLQAEGPLNGIAPDAVVQALEQVLGESSLALNRRLTPRTHPLA